MIFSLFCSNAPNADHAPVSLPIGTLGSQLLGLALRCRHHDLQELGRIPSIKLGQDIDDKQA